MPIVKRPGSDNSTTEEGHDSPSAPIIRKQAKTPVDHAEAPVSASPQGSSTSTSSGLPMIQIAAIAIIVVLGLFGAFLYSNWAADQQAQEQAEVSLVSDIDRLIQIGGMMELAHRKISQNQLAVENAKQLEDKMLESAISTSLAQNMNDLRTYNGDFASTLAQIYQVYQQNPELVNEEFKLEMKQGETSYSMGRVETITRAIELLESVPEGARPLEYFQGELE